MISTLYFLSSILFFIMQYFVCYLRDIFCLVDGKRKEKGSIPGSLLLFDTCVYFSKKFIF